MPDPDRFDLPAPTTGRPEDITDWLEGLAFLEDRQVLSRAVIRDLLTGVGIDDDSSTLSDLVLAQVERRRDVAPQRYPFTRDDVGIKRSVGIDPAVYEHILWLSISPAFRKLGDFRQADLLFDYLVLAALVTWIGRGGQGLRIAHPAHGDQPAGFRNNLERLANRMGLGVRDGPDPDLKDGGVDVVVWRRFLDSHAGFIIALCQATLQDKLRDKARDIEANSWRRWLAIDQDPIAIHAVPFSLTIPEIKWEELSGIVHFVMDRFRLCEYLSEPFDRALVEAIRDWNRVERQRLMPSTAA
jgi:hypothetical protein